MYTKVTSSTKPWMAGKSLLSSALYEYWPRPGQAKMISTSTSPPSA